MLTPEITQVSNFKVFDSESKTFQVGNFEKNGFSITKGQKFIVPNQEGTNCSIIEQTGACILLTATEINNTHIVTDSHGSFTKDICWKQVN